MFLKKDTQRINFPMLAKVLGWLLMIEGAFMLIPACVSLYYCESDWEPFGISAAFTILTGFALTNFIHAKRTSMAKREGFLLTTLVWIVFSLFGLLPFLFCSSPLGFSDAFFEAMAGFTTTGCSAFNDIGSLSHGINIWRALMQWIGGMGIILFTLAVIPMLNHSGGMQMFNAEVTGITHDKIRPRISQTAKSLWLTYIILTISCALLLWAGPMSLFDSICHAMGTLSTGGFSTRTLGIVDWDSNYIYIVITAFMFLGGMNFSVIFFTAMGNFKPLRNNRTSQLYIFLIFAYTLMVILNLLIYRKVQTWEDASIFPLFQIIATMTSTGYLAKGIETWGAFIYTLMLPIMFFGACAGSTSGGAKLDRLVVLGKYLRNSLKRALHPNNITTVKVNGNVLEPDLVSKTIAFLCLLCLVICAGSVILAMLNVPLIDSVFSSLSCTSNLGVGTDSLGCGGGFSIIPAAGKWVLSALMLIGRLEVFTVLILFIPNFWHK